MGYELIRQIGTTVFCLTYDTDKSLLAVKRFIADGDNRAGSSYVEKPLNKKKLDTMSTRSPEYLFIKKSCKTVNSAELIRESANPNFFNELEKALDELQMDYLVWLDGAEQRREEELQREAEAKAEALEELVSEGAEALNEEEHPLLWIANTIDWLTAGERMNILYAWITFCSQVILENPISVVGIGEANSGKTHIIEAALSMIPDEYVLTMKSATMAATYALADTDPFYFDKKIVYIGDMGGDKDHEEAQLFKNLMKELQSDGQAKRIKMIDGPEGPEPKWYILQGYPCLTYTTVPGYQFEDQEMSRSIMLSPRQDNDEAVSIYKHLKQMKRGPTKDNLDYFEGRLPVIKNMVLALKQRMEYVEIINPYRQFIRDYLNKTKFFKRDFDKYNGILKVITAINGYNRQLIDNVLFTTVDDIMIFVDILARYHESITANLSPNAADILKELRDKADDWDLYEEGITVNDYMYNSIVSQRFAKKSVQRYFGDLNAAGMLKSEKEGKENRYFLVSTGLDLKESDVKMPPIDQKMLEYNYGINCEVLHSLGGPSPEKISKVIDGPFWNDVLPENNSNIP